MKQNSAYHWLIAFYRAKFVHRLENLLFLTSKNPLLKMICFFTNWQLYFCNTIYIACSKYNLLHNLFSQCSGWQFVPSTYVDVDAVVWSKCQLLGCRSVCSCVLNSLTGVEVMLRSRQFFSIHYFVLWPEQLRLSEVFEFIPTNVNVRMMRVTLKEKCLMACLFELLWFGRTGGRGLAFLTIFFPNFHFVSNSV